MVRALDFYPGGPGSNPIRNVGFFQTMHNFLVTNFAFVRLRLYCTYDNFKWWFSYGLVLKDVHNVVSNLWWVVIDVINVYDQRGITCPLGRAQLITCSYFEVVLVG